MIIKIKNIYFYLLIFIPLSFGFSQDSGCMDDGYQHWSPNFGSPACNYDSSAIVNDQDSCKYYDCTGDCKNPSSSDFVKFDDCGVCGGNNTPGTGSCDCAGIPDGTAYENHHCSNNVCVGGQTNNSDCVAFYVDQSDEILSMTSDNIIKLYALNIDQLQSLDMELIYNINYIELADIEFYNTSLNSDDYQISFNTTILSSEIAQTKLTLFFNPKSSSSVPFDLLGLAHLLNIIINVKNPQYDIITPLEIVSLTINENDLPADNWQNGYIEINHVGGCLTEPTESNPICNYEPLAIYDDGTCSIEEDNCGNCIEAGKTYNCEEDCAGVWGGESYLNCENNCVTYQEDDCFSAQFITYDLVTQSQVNTSSLYYGNFSSNGETSDSLIVAVNLSNIPQPLESIELSINYDSDLLLLDTESPNRNVKLESNKLVSDFDIPSLFDQNYNNYNMQVGFDGTDLLVSIYLVQDVSIELSTTGPNNIFFIKFVLKNMSYEDLLNNDLLGTFINLKYNMISINGNDMSNDYFLSEEYKILSIEDSIFPDNYSLGQNYPNPFNPITYINYSLSLYDLVSISIYDISGQEVKCLINNTHPPGEYKVTWDGTNNNGLTVSAGIYYYKMITTEFTSIKKLILLK